jgi:hypothetical protein
MELEQRREEIRCELKSSLKLNRRTEKTIDVIIDKSWDELLAIIKAGISDAPVFPIAAGKIVNPPRLEEIEELEIIEELEELEEVKELEEAKDSAAESKITNNKPVRKSAGKGLLALANEINLNSEYPITIDELETDSEPIKTELDIVSPFDSMFSMLDEKNPKPEEE